ncbi:MAG: class I SAM-dependent methyltransferase [Lachnospiraceae bacterium]|nr:class I SAM-dependent methyltransferase [Lachnospiraceae bacterium]
MTAPVLSERLQAVADMVPRCRSAADIGTDHGYIPIYLVSSGSADRAAAADLRPGPLSAAEANIKARGLSDRISLRLSDGLGNISPEEAEVIVIAGMGGMLTVKILTEGRELMKSAKACVLEPQSDLGSVRSFLFAEGMSITAEKMVFDAGKYYTVIRAEFAGPERAAAEAAAYSRADLSYGKLLIDSGDRVLEEKLEAGKQKTLSILDPLEKAADGDLPGNPRTEERMRELKEELRDIEEALSRIRSSRCKEGEKP